MAAAFALQMSWHVPGHHTRALFAHRCSPTMHHPSRVLYQAEGALPDVGVQFADYDERQVGQPAPKLFASRLDGVAAMLRVSFTVLDNVLQLRSFFGALYRAVLAAGQCQRRNDSS
jgi:hypothetical protein